MKRACLLLGVVLLVSGCAAFEHNADGEIPIFSGLFGAGKEAVRQAPNLTTGGPWGWVTGIGATLLAGIVATVRAMGKTKKER